MTTAGTVAAATFTQRAIARCIDFAILTVLIVLAVTPFNDDDTLDAPPLFLVALIVAVLAYEVIPVHLRGQTPGKVLLRTRVVQIEDGRPPSVKRSLIRWGIVCVVWVVIGNFVPPLAVVTMAGLYLSALADPEGRTVLDKLAGTRVVRADAAAREVTPPE